MNGIVVLLWSDGTEGFMGWVLIWLVCAVSCGVIAGTKNRNVIGWFICGFLFGFFAVVAISFVKVLPPAVVVVSAGGMIVEAAPDAVVSEDVRCPFCRELIRRDAALCKHCGSKLED